MLDIITHLVFLKVLHYPPLLQATRGKIVIVNEEIEKIHFTLARAIHHNENPNFEGSDDDENAEYAEHSNEKWDGLSDGMTDGAENFIPDETSIQ